MKKITSLLFMVFAAMTMNAKTIYCQMPYDWWWANDGEKTAAISLYAYGEGDPNAEWPGQLMSEVDALNHIWSIDIELGDYTSIIFARSSSDNDNWGAQTGDLPINEIGENDMYIITSASARWAGEEQVCEGYWSVYGSEPIAPTYVTRHIFVDNQTGWAEFDLYAWGASEIFGGWPGNTNPATVTVDGVIYLDYVYEGAEGIPAEYHLIFHNNVGEGVEGDMRQLYDVTEARDYYLLVTADAVTEVQPTAVEEVAVKANASVKKIVNGQLVIMREGKAFNALGAEMK